MTASIAAGPISHLTLTVSDVDRAREFYTKVLGFQFVTQVGARPLLGNGSVIPAGPLRMPLAIQGRLAHAIVINGPVGPPDGNNILASLKKPLVLRIKYSAIVWRWRKPREA